MKKNFLKIIVVIDIFGRIAFLKKPLKEIKKDHEYNE